MPKAPKPIQVPFDMEIIPPRVVVEALESAYNRQVFVTALAHDLGTFIALCNGDGGAETLNTGLKALQYSIAATAKRMRERIEAAAISAQEPAQHPTNANLAFDITEAALARAKKGTTP